MTSSLMDRWTYQVDTSIRHQIKHRGGPMKGREEEEEKKKCFFLLFMKILYSQMTLAVDTFHP